MSEYIPPHLRTSEQQLEHESILEEAFRLTHGPRAADYGHPLDNMGLTAAIVSAILSRKLKESISADEMALVLVGVKLARQLHRTKRDNMTDIAGYAWVAQECLDEIVRRNGLSTKETDR
jgi:hypothetical protein